MHAEKPVLGNRKDARIYQRILGDVQGECDEALIFAASSIIHEITSLAYDGAAVVREVRTDRGVHTLSGSVVYTTAGAQPVIVVNMRGGSADQAEVRENRVRAFYGLTRKEYRVALLLEESKSNDEIADALFISPHTARHHTESVLDKLRISSRRDVASALSRC